MNERVSDAELKDAVRRLAPGVDTSTFCRELGERCAEKKQGRHRGRRLRLVAIGAAVVVVLAGVSAGLVTGLSHLRGTQSVIVFTDAPTTDDPSLSSTTTTMGVGPRLAWGEEAVLDGRTIKVEQPVEVPGVTLTVEVPDNSRAPSVLVVAYSLVTITNTGSEPLTCAAQEFSLMGNSSGSTGGIGGPGETLAGHEVLDLVTLQPGESVEVAVRFGLKQGDHPVKVLLGTRDSTGTFIARRTNGWPYGSELQIIAARGTITETRYRSLALAVHTHVFWASSPVQHVSKRNPFAASLPFSVEKPAMRRTLYFCIPKSRGRRM